MARGIPPHPYANPNPVFDPPVQALLAGYQAMAGTPFNPAALPQARMLFSAMAQDRKIDPSVDVTDVVIDGISVRLYRPRIDGDLPLHLYCHGGGFIVGSALSGESDGFLSRRAVNGRCLVASAEYGLAPEHPFPQGLEDCYRALVGLVSQAAQFRIDTRAITVGGASSGGNFAAVLSMMCRDRKGPKLTLQLLEIAGTDLTKSTFSWRNPLPGNDITRERDLSIVDLYLPNPKDRALPYASPMMAPALTDLPPAYVMNGEFDQRRDECETYVTRLNDAGVQAVSRTMAGHIHGSLWLQGWPPAQAWQEEADHVLLLANEAAVSGQPLLLPSAG